MRSRGGIEPVSGCGRPAPPVHLRARMRMRSPRGLLYFAALMMLALQQHACGAPVKPPPPPPYDVGIFEPPPTPSLPPPPGQCDIYSPQYCDETGECCPGDLQCAINLDTNPFSDSACCGAGVGLFCNGTCCEGTCTGPYGPPANYTCCPPDNAVIFDYPSEIECCCAPGSLSYCNGRCSDQLCCGGKSCPATNSDGDCTLNWDDDLSDKCCGPASVQFCEGKCCTDGQCFSTGTGKPGKCCPTDTDGYCLVEGPAGSRAPGCCPSPSSCVFEIDAANQAVLDNLYCCPGNNIDFCDGACSPTPCCNGKPCVAGPGVDPLSIFCVTDIDTGVGACCVDAYQNCGGECCAGECVAGAPGQNKTCMLPPAAPGG